MTALMLALLVGASPTEGLIKAQRPGLDASYVANLAKSIDRRAREHGIEPALMVAIIRVESYFRSGVKACWPDKKNPGGETCDHGLGQVNDVWIRQWKLDAERLVFDEGYNIAIMSRILAWLKLHYGHEDEWYLRYHSNDPKRQKDYRQKLHNAGFPEAE